MNQSPHRDNSMRQPCVAYGVRFLLQAASPELLAKMLLCVPHGTRLEAVSEESSQLFTLTDESPASLEQLTQDLMIHVADLAPDRVFVHAGVAGWRGRALVMPGISFAGKTTLVAELVRAGATYYSDEYALVDAHGLVHPYTRDLQMRQPGRPEQKSLPVAQLAGTVGVDALSVAQVVFVNYVPGGLWSPQPVSPGLAVLEMLRHAIPVQRSPARVMATLAAMMAPATAWRSERGDAAETAQLLLATMDA